jgi:ABC-type multidrug transport system fused ATPase/permease subunit
MIISDLMKMVVVLAFMFYMNWKLTWIVVMAMPILVVITRVFNAKCRCFEEVRAQIANMNSFVQERNRYENRATFTREIIEADKFKEINDKHRHGLKPFCTTPSSSLLLILFRH